MDLDEEELKATKRILKNPMTNRYIEIEKSADEMFEELGYKKDIEVSYGLIRYNKDDNSFIRFLIEEECVETNTIIRNQIYVLSMDMKLLKAINKKCKELRMDLKKEWKEIKGYEGKYIISNYGEIISLPRYKENNSKLQYVEPKEICKYVNKHNGYVYVQLWNDAKYKNIRLHRLVAENFLINNDNKPQVNHIDGNKQNNKVDNLEWVTGSENIIHAYKTGLRKRGG